LHELQELVADAFALRGLLGLPRAQRL